MARVLVEAGGGRAQGRPARGAGLHRVRPRERQRLPHLHGHRPGPVRGPVLQLPARSDAQAPAGRADQLPQGRVPGLTLAAPTRTTILLVTGAAVAWVVTVERMRGMDAGPGTDLGGLGWFLRVWGPVTLGVVLPSGGPAARAVAPPPPPHPPPPL